MLEKMSRVLIGVHFHYITLEMSRYLHASHVCMFDSNKCPILNLAYI